ncbi:thioredoxin family protein [uncultured Secundilactobacillus sp.]|uniref:thioredoxin family protein n=1 Tax=uncultured Secundilactobacillus sp. TaxID=2813935 RepID=UPI00258DD6E2|nr:thioredoxin family protein [uncultured Secundilactobacillus sp.]
MRKINVSKAIIGFSLGIAMVGLGGWLAWSKAPYPVSSNSQISQVVQADKPKKTAFLVFYRSTCPDCLAVKNTVRWAAEKVQFNHAKVAYVATNKRQNQAWLTRYSITEVPTIVALHKDGQVTWLTGTNRAQIKAFFQTGGESHGQR